MQRILGEHPLRIYRHVFVVVELLNGFRKSRLLAKRSVQLHQVAHVQLHDRRELDARWRLSLRASVAQHQVVVAVVGLSLVREVAHEGAH